MLNPNYKLSSVVAFLAVLALASPAAIRGADPCVERARVARYYECCYGPYCYARSMSWGRCSDPNYEAYLAAERLRKEDQSCKDKACKDPTCKHARCGHDHGCCCCCCSCCSGNCCMQPGSKPPSKCWDIYLYRAVWPMSPWYSNPRDGIIYPAYGSKSPTCVPEND